MAAVKNGKGPSDQSFGFWRQTFFPIHHFEIKKFLPMLLMLLFIGLNYTTTRNLKDSLITGEVNGKIVLPVLKWGVVLPFSLFFTIIYAKLSNALSRQRLFYSVLMFFTAYFAIFALLYPYLGAVHASPETLRAWEKLPTYMAAPALIGGVWSYSLFYALTEIWGNVGTSILFWQFANQIVRSSESKRFYPTFAIGSALSLMLSGGLIKLGKILTKPVELPSGGKDFSGQIYLYLGITCVLMFVVAFLYRWINANVLTDPACYDEASADKKAKPKKPKLSMGESFKMICSSKYLGLIVLMILGYNIIINVVEVSWKDAVSIYYKKDKSDISSFFATTYTWIGVVTLFGATFGQLLVRKLGWYAGAMATPLICVGLGLLFFCLLIFSGMTTSLAAMLGATPLGLTIVVGAVHNVLTKGFKYALFDTTKEMTYIPLDEELKVKGKAAVDVFGGRLGKAGGSMIQSGTQVALSFAGGMAFLDPVYASFIAVLGFFWFMSVGGLNKEYAAKLREREAEKK